MTYVPGQDGTTVKYSTNYTSTGVYHFYVEGDYTDITFINHGGYTFITLDVSQYSNLDNLNFLILDTTSVSGDIGALSGLLNLLTLACNDSNVSGDISVFKDNTTITTLRLARTGVFGEISELGGYSLNDIRLLETNISKQNKGVYQKVAFFRGLELYNESQIAESFNSIVPWTFVGTLDLTDCSLQSIEIDNCLISLANGTVTNTTINIGGNNAARTSASDSAKATLLANGCTVTVNE